ncbi:MAG: phosphoribosylanthranilate isomerase [Bacteroidales bacterium]|nr:phosphoribosylanthranilate isomerase [Bacteroidales bacterium]
MIVKVCGMRDAENIRAVARLGVDMLGFICYPASSRYVPEIPSRGDVFPGVVSDGGQAFPHFTGVFVDETPERMVRLASGRLDCIQLHGQETPAMVERLRRQLTSAGMPGVTVMKALSIRDATDVDRWRDYAGLADMFLFDTKCAEHGGSGCQFDWNLLSAYDGAIPFLLSGGIGPEDAGRIARFRHPALAGIDLNSRFETAPAVKDVILLEKFLQTLKTYEQN